jgi:DUF2971 family protein
MSDAGEAVRKHRALLTAQFEQRQELRESAAKLRFAWVEGREKLFKFKSLSGGSRDQVLDVITNSRIYFSSPDQFNDPLDCAPVCVPAKSTSDPQFVQEMLEDEAALASAAGKSPEEIEALRQAEGVPPNKVGSAVTARLRAELINDARVFCLSASDSHPLLWSHYADSHRGVCLHFRAAPGSLFGLARAVEYRSTRLPILVPLKYNKSEDDIAETMVRVKAEYWGYENEYRIIAHEGTDWGDTLLKRFCSFPPKLLCGLTLGMKISPADRRALIELSTKRHPAIAVYQAEEAPDRFWIDAYRVI